MTSAAVELAATQDAEQRRLAQEFVAEYDQAVDAIDDQDTALREMFERLEVFVDRQQHCWRALRTAFDEEDEQGRSRSGAGGASNGPAAFLEWRTEQEGLAAWNALRRFARLHQQLREVWLERFASPEPAPDAPSDMAPDERSPASPSRPPTPRSRPRTPSPTPPPVPLVAPTPPTPDEFERTLQGKWQVTVSWPRNPAAGSQVFHVHLAKKLLGRRTFELRGAFGAANGTWHVPSGSSIVMEGWWVNGMVYSATVSFFNISPDRLEGVDQSNATVSWRRERGLLSRR